MIKYSNNFKKSGSYLLDPIKLKGSIAKIQTLEGFEHDMHVVGTGFFKIQTLTFYFLIIVTV